MPEFALKDIQVSEGWAGNWRYHLSRKSEPFIALCRAQTMKTKVQLEAWDQTPADYHMPESWCQKCEEIANAG